MAYTRRQGTTRTTSTGANKVVATPTVDDLDETEQGQEELEEGAELDEDDAEEEEEPEEEEEETGAEEQDEPAVVETTIPVTAPAPANATAPAMELEVPTGTPVQIIHQCNHKLGELLETLMSNPQHQKRVVTLLNSNAPVEGRGNRPGDYWLQGINHYQGIKRQATNDLVAQAMRQ